MVNVRGSARGPQATDFRLAPSALAAWATAIYVSRDGHVDSVWTAPVLWGCAAGLGIFAWYLTSRNGPAVWRTAAVVACLGTLGVAGVLGRVGFSNPSSTEGMSRLATQAAEQGVTVRATFEVVGAARSVSSRFGGATMIPARLHRLEVGPEKATGSMPITVRWSGADSSWFSHDDHELMSAVATIRPEADGRISLKLRNRPRGVGREGPVRSASTWRSDLRRSMSERSQRLLDTDVGALVMGMSYGDDSRLSPEARDAMRISGLTHLTAVSGSNVALVAVVGTWAARSIRCPRIVGFLVAIAAVWGFVRLVGPEPSVLRASWMGILGAIGMTLGRTRPTMSALWASMVGLLILDPGLSTDLGFVLSVLATLGILSQGTALSEWLVRFCPRTLADTLSMSIVATVWCAPVVTAISGTVGAFTVVANVLVAPVVPIVTVVGLGATLAASIPSAADVLTVVAGYGAKPILVVGETIASLPGASVPIGDDTRAMVGTILVSLVLVVGIFLLSSWQRTRLVNDLEGKG